MKMTFAFLGLLALSATATAFTARETRAQDPSALIQAISKSKHSLSEGLRQLSNAPETPLSAKFEFDDSGKLSLSVYTAEKGLNVDAEHNVLKEYSGSPELAAWAPGVEIFKDVEHIARSAQQQTLVALARESLLEVVADVEKKTRGQVICIKPVLDGRKAYYGVKTLVGGKVVESKHDLFSDDDDDESDG